MMRRMDTLLLIEDDHRLAQMVVEYLQQSGYAVDHAATAHEGLEALTHQPPALVLLDLMLPDADGLELCRRIRALPGALGRIPVVMLTAKGDPMDRVVGLEIGADDYLPKPFEPRELLARIRAVLRRHGAPSAPSTLEGKPQQMQFGSLILDRDARTVLLREKTCDITAYQFDLLWALAERAGRVLSHDQATTAIHTAQNTPSQRAALPICRRIRLAIEDDVKHPKRILTVRGVGYVFAKQQD